MAVTTAALRVVRGSGTVVAAQTARRAIRSGVLWGYIFGITIASSALTYPRLYKTASDRDQLAATYGANKAVSALFGPAPHLNTVAGFTAFKVSMTLMILGSVWGILTGTRLLRGEEDAGRWELLLTGRTTRRRAVLQGMVGLAAGAACLFLLTAVLAVLAGRPSSVSIAVGPALFFAVAMVSPAVMFLAVGAVTSQLASTRRRAAAYGAVVLGVSYALRMVADAGVGAHWLLYTNPLGWVEALGALVAPTAWPLLFVAGFTFAAGAIAVVLAGVRDVGAGVLADRTHARARLGLLSNQLGLTVRLVRPVVVAWMVALAATGLLLGGVAKGAGGTLSGSAQEVLERLGATGSGVELYLGVSYLIVAVLVAFVAAGQVTATREEEAEGHLEHLVVRPVSRTAWFGGRMGVTLAVLVSGGLTAGFFTWVGTAGQQAGVGLGTLLLSGLNVVPPAVCVAGVGAAAFGIWPRAAAFAAYGLLGWSLLIDVAGGFGSVAHWLLDTSVFHQMAGAPAVPPNAVSAGIMAAVGLVGLAAGAVAFRRRDIVGY
jgi:ABC-2 type transport system permease protein